MKGALCISVLCTIVAICLSDSNANQAPPYYQQPQQLRRPEYSQRLMPSQRSSKEPIDRNDGYITPPLVPPVPCPQFFQYEPNRTDNWFFGHLTLPPFVLSTNIYAVEINMSVNADVPPKEGLRLKLVSSHEDIFNGQRVQYLIMFPNSNPRTLPQLTNIKLNADNICHGPAPPLVPGVVQSGMWTKAVIQTSNSGGGHEQTTAPNYNTNPYPGNPPYNPNPYPDNTQYNPNPNPNPYPYPTNPTYNPNGYTTTFPTYNPNSYTTYPPYGHNHYQTQPSYNPNTNPTYAPYNPYQ